MSFDFNSKPSLIGPKMKKTVYKVMKQTSTNSIISEKISNSVNIFYDDYIAPNKLIAVSIIIVILFLIYRYYTKGENKEFFTKYEHNIIDDITGIQTAHLRHDTQHTFNHLIPVNQQHEHVNYPPDPLPVNLPDKGIVYTKNLGNYPPMYPNLNQPQYDYNNVYKYPSRSYYTGTYNTYKNAQDTDIANPLGFSNRFNSSTGQYVTHMTDKNKQNITDYQTIIDNMNGDLYSSMKYGPNGIDPFVPEPKIEPPYSTEIL